MIQTVEAVIDEHGVVRLMQPIRVPAARRALVTILEEQPAVDVSDVASVEDWGMSRDDMPSLLREIAAWEAVSDEDALKIEKLLLELG